MNLDEILNLEDETDAIIQIGQSLWEKSKDDQDFESLNDFEKNVLYVEMLEGEINNGGFDQYFFNSSGEYAHETLEALKAIQAPQMAEILNKAIKAFPGLSVPKDEETRREFMDEIPENISDIWESLDQEFYDYPENLTASVLKYIKENRAHFD